MTRSRPLSMVFGHESGNPLHFNLDPTPKSPTLVAALHRQIRNRGEQGSSGSPAPSVFSDTGRRVVRRRAAAFKSGWKKYGATERRSRSDLYEPRLWITSGLLTIQGYAVCSCAYGASAKRSFTFIVRKQNPVWYTVRTIVRGEVANDGRGDFEYSDAW